eukprot:TRINITY_DN4415_c0_g1_i5.p1 TRINITY_DN4415_c0_g1~~TRINITY_DN4415_c0_g1_i5.p1  ORF type:complete len:592 (+),score=98.69 TRINITY_DN4415_c0_g1_i5:122-1897(+)
MLWHHVKSICTTVSIFLGLGEAQEKSIGDAKSGKCYGPKAGILRLFDASSVGIRLSMLPETHHVHSCEVDHGDNVYPGKIEDFSSCFRKLAPRILATSSCGDAMGTESTQVATETVVLREIDSNCLPLAALLPASKPLPPTPQRFAARCNVEADNEAPLKKHCSGTNENGENKAPLAVLLPASKPLPPTPQRVGARCNAEAKQETPLKQQRSSTNENDENKAPLSNLGSKTLSAPTQDKQGILTRSVLCENVAPSTQLSPTKKASGCTVPSSPMDKPMVPAQRVVSPAKAVFAEQKSVDEQEEGPLIFAAKVPPVTKIGAFKKSPQLVYTKPTSAVQMPAHLKEEAPAQSPQPQETIDEPMEFHFMQDLSIYEYGFNPLRPWQRVQLPPRVVQVGRSQMDIDRVKQLSTLDNIKPMAEAQLQWLQPMQGRARKNTSRRVHWNPEVVVHAEVVTDELHDYRFSAYLRGQPVPLYHRADYQLALAVPAQIPAESIVYDFNIQACIYEARINALANGSHQRFAESWGEVSQRFGPVYTEIQDYLDAMRCDLDKIISAFTFDSRRALRCSARFGRLEDHVFYTPRRMARFVFVSQ